MKYASLLLAAVMLCCGTARALEPGQAAPVLEVPGTAAPIDLAALKGKVVYVDFWASWCAPCKQSFPWMNEMQAKYGPRGFQIVAVNLDAKRADADKFLAEVPANFLVGFDAKGDSPKRFQIKGMPSSVLVGPNGQVVQVHTGFRPEERKAQEDAIVAALAQLK